MESMKLTTYTVGAMKYLAILIDLCSPAVHAQGFTVGSRAVGAISVLSDDNVAASLCVYDSSYECVFVVTSEGYVRFGRYKQR
jgi:hypothetical protein